MQGRREQRLVGKSLPVSCFSLTFTCWFFIMHMIMNKKLLFLFFCLCVSLGSLQAQQREISESQNSWFMLMNEFRLSPKWFISNEVHIRRANGLKDWQQFLLRPALNYRLDPNIELAAGYSYILTYPYGEQPVAVRAPEHNIWQQLLLRHAVGKVGFTHRYRLEERFVGNIEQVGNTFEVNGSNYRQRFRYRLTANLPLKRFAEYKVLFVAAFNELWVNLDDILFVNSFNQNWIYAGLGYQFSEVGNIQAGYLDQLISKGGNRYERNPTISVSLFYHFNFFKLAE